MSRVIFPTFPCVICGMRFDTEEEYIRYCDEAKEKYPKLHESVMKCIREEWDLLKGPSIRERLRPYHVGNSPMKGQSPEGMNSKEEL